MLAKIRLWVCRPVEGFELAVEKTANGLSQVFIT